MSIYEREFEQWNEDDLRELRGEREHARLEFKREVSLQRDSGRVKFAKEVAAMANASGGVIIIGIAEERQPDGSRVAGEIVPLADGRVPEQIDALVADHISPRPSYRVRRIDVAGGFCVAIEVSLGTAPHQLSNHVYYTRDNFRVSRMREAEVREAYRRAYRREWAAERALEEWPPDGQPRAEGGRERADAVVLHHGLLAGELAAFREETGIERRPGWLSVVTRPVPLRPGLVSVVERQPEEFGDLPPDDIRLEPDQRLQVYLRLRRTALGFFGQLPHDGPFPSFLLRLWENGVLEYGDLLVPALRHDDARDFTLPTTSVLWYVHDSLALFYGVYERVGYDGPVHVELRLDNVAGYCLGIEPGIQWNTIALVRAQDYRIPEENDPVVVESDAMAPDLLNRALPLTRGFFDQMWLAAGVESRSQYFVDDETLHPLVLRHSRHVE
jgi:hypothetical protein